MKTSVMTLYRPVGPKELKLIEDSGWRRFPPRLPEQPIFYPVLQQEYAERIARDWNVKSSGAGFVTRFAVDEQYVAQFELHSAGGSQFSEYWIPADRLEEFNDHIRGRIEVIAEFGPQAGYALNQWVRVYDLAQDRETIELVQRATLNTQDFGLVPEVALFGSEEWWKAIEDGRIPKHEVRGTISRIYMSGHGDWPEFEVDSNGERTRWTRVGEQTMYEEGREVRIDYVMQKTRKNWLGSSEQKQVLRIFIQRC